jgi:hypothetical protein
MNVEKQVVNVLVIGNNDIVDARGRWMKSNSDGERIVESLRAIYATYRPSPQMAVRGRTAANIAGLPAPNCPSCLRAAL